ncbi:RluA family pseudouridine synthase [Hathewaya histolytica]|uniref:Pseudouridine synthase n=1 Tax=Hathewaya histolytica TaxID=1498 RepID=A0A4U9RFV6_HATHI|nr:RluA family pseudouridine synthase [Hathewaya histolytica]VTQ90782.1 RluA family pseudouridine synthase [Hathewaya histolytica]
MRSNFLQIRVTEELDKVKLRNYLKYHVGLSSRLIKKAAMEKRILVNEEIIKLNYVVKKEDEIKIDLNREESQNITPQNIPINIIYEDEDIIVVDKEPFMVVHPTKSHKEGTLANGVLYHFKVNGEGCIVRLVSRLDMDTSGLVIIAKNQHSHMNLAKDMENNNIDKIYLAIVHGKLSEKSGKIDLPIGKPSFESIKREVMKEGQTSITHYEVLEEYKDASLVKLKLETGRTHQIRVHLSHIGHPIYGDALYGKEENELIQRQALHAYKLKFLHPKNRNQMNLEASIPKDINDLLKKLKVSKI